jgi:hypothetical protein
MSIKKYINEMDSVKNEIHSMLGDKSRPSLGEGLSGFWERAKFSISLIFLEKELITFAVLQWVCIIVGYYLWVQMIGWIPEEAWEKIGSSTSDTPSAGDVIFFLWSFVCVGLVAFPLGLLSGCMGAVHFLNKQGKESTIVACMKMVLPRAWPLWIFHWIDGWYTVNRILDRLPKKNDHRTAAQKALSEALYYAWKIGTIGIMPGLVTGRGLIDSTKRSVGMVIKKFKDVIILRGGYSALCWIIGIGTYIGTIYFFIMFPSLADFKAPVESMIYEFYFWAGVPMMISVGVIMLFLRPIYIISACDIYADYVQEQGENLMLPPPPNQNKSYDLTAVATVILLLLTVIGFIIFRNEIGLTDMLSDGW